MFSLFRRGEVSRKDFEQLRADVDAELSRHASVIRTLEAEQATMHDQVRKWMRRAIAAERAAGGADEVERSASSSAARDTDGRSHQPQNLWGARARRARRPANGEDVTSGVHP